MVESLQPLPTNKEGGGIGAQGGGAGVGEGPLGPSQGLSTQFAGLIKIRAGGEGGKGVALS